MSRSSGGTPFIRRMRDEPLNWEVFANLKEARVPSGEYCEHYNHHRPHAALGYLTPMEFAELERLSGRRSAREEESRS